MTWRPLTEGDARAFAEHINETCDADGIDRRTDEAFLPALLNGPRAHRDLDFARGAFDGDRMVAAGAVLPDTAADPVHRVNGYSSVGPDHRGLGLGTELLRWMCALAPQVHARHFPGRPLELSVTVPGTDRAALALLAAEGFGLAYWGFSMTRAEDTPVPDAPPADGLDLVPYDDRFREELRVLNNAVFADQPHESPFTPPTWDEYLDRGGIRPELSFLAVDRATGALAGYLLSSVNTANAEATGTRTVHFDLIGTAAAHRRRGVASALIAHTLSAARAAGYPTASLGVDADNPNDALGFYQRQGFTVRQSWAHHGKPLAEA